MVLPVNVVVPVTANVPILPMPAVVTFPPITLAVALSVVPITAVPRTFAPDMLAELLILPVELNMLVTETMPVPLAESVRLLLSD